MISGTRKETQEQGEGKAKESSSFPPPLTALPLEIKIFLPVHNISW